MPGGPRSTLAGAVVVVALIAAGCTSEDRPAADRPAAGAAAAPTRPACMATPGGAPQGGDPAAPGTPSRVRLGPGGQLTASPANLAASRRGQRLLVSGVVYQEDCAAPLAGATINVWQTNKDGVYGPAAPSGGEVRCCYLQGTVRTDAAGRYALDTVMPGRYPDARAPAHIHFEVSHPKAKGVLTELLFAGDPYLDAVAEPGAVARVSRAGGTLTASFDIVLRTR
jgi:protocatechuate 3,4-dioxygenase beta subunit